MMTHGFIELSQVHERAPFAGLGRHLKGLNFGAGDVANLWRNFRARLQCLPECAHRCFAVDEHFDGIGELVLGARDDDERFHTLGLLQNGLQSRREKGSAFEFKLLVFSTDDWPQAWGGATAFARRLKERGAIACAIANQWHSFDAEGCRDDLTDFTIRKRVACVVENVKMEQLGMQMSARACVTFTKGIGKLGDSVGGINARGPGRLDCAAGCVQSKRAVADGFADANCFFYRTVFQVETCFLRLFGNDAKERRDADNSRWSNALNHFQNECRRGWTDSHDRAAEFPKTEPISEASHETAIESDRD